MGISIIEQPPYTPYLGPVVIHSSDIKQRQKKYSLEDRVHDVLIQQLKKIPFQRFKLRPEQETWLAYYYRGYRSNVYYTYRLRLSDDLEKNYKGSVKNHIKYTLKNYTLSQDSSGETLYKMTNATFERKKTNQPIHKNVFLNLCDEIIQRDMGKILTLTRGNTTLGSALVVFDKEVAYLLMLGVDKSQKPRGVAQRLIWECIKEANKRVQIFDFEGSMIPEVEKVFRSFGGKRTPVKQICKAPRWAEIAFILMNKARW